MRSVTVFLLLSGVVASLAAKTKLSNIVTLCSKSDPNLKDCLKKSGNDIIPHLMKGIRDYGFPPVDPLKLPFMELSQSDRPVGLKLNITNSLHNIQGVTVKDVDVDLAKGHLLFHIYFPKYEINGHCDVGGRILLLPITGSGDCFLAANEMSATLRFLLKTETKNGKEYFNNVESEVKLKFTKGAFHLDGLFGGNKELGATMNRFLNENALEVFNEMKPTLEKVWTALYGGLVGRVFASIPASDLFNP